MELVDLLNKANNGYPDGFLTEFYDEKTGQLKDGKGDGLAKFIVVELAETFVKDAPESDQIHEAIMKLTRAGDELENVIDALTAD